MKIDVLDHGFARLVSYMQPALATARGWDDIVKRETWTGDLEVVRNARVSHDADWRSDGDDNQRDSKSKDEKLIGYMMENAHTSPFEAMVFTFEIKAPIFVVRQWHRHRTWSYNEVSARYAELPEEFYVPRPEHLGKQSKSNKQARDLTSVDEILAQTTIDYMRDLCERGFRLYRQFLADGVPRELARTVLPLSTYTRFFATVDLHNLLHFVKLRAHPHAQYEIRVYAEALLELARSVVPVSVAAFERREGKSAGHSQEDR